MGAAHSHAESPHSINLPTTYYSHFCTPPPYTHLQISLWSVDPWELLTAALPGRAANLEHVEGVSMGARALLALACCAEAAGGPEAVRKLCVVVHCNGDQEVRERMGEGERGNGKGGEGRGGRGGGGRRGGVTARGSAQAVCGGVLQRGPRGEGEEWGEDFQGGQRKEGGRGKGRRVKGGNLKLCVAVVWPEPFLYPTLNVHYLSSPVTCVAELCDRGPACDALLWPQFRQHCHCPALALTHAPCPFLPCAAELCD